MKKKLSLFLAIMVALLGGVVLVGAAPQTAPSIGAVAANPSTIFINTPVAVTVTAAIADPNVLPTGVNLLRLSSSGTSAILGVMHDDGLNGDAVANDKTFSFRSTFSESSVGQIQLQVSAAFKGVLKRVLSSTFNLSSVLPQVGVPNVVGLTQTAATSAITGAGLVLGTVTQQSSSTVAAGIVISENPTAGTTVNTGSAVNLVASSGPLQVGVLNVIGLTQAAATSSLTGTGLVVGTITQQSSSTVPAGNVISENPAAGTMVNVGSAVNLAVSSGAPQVAVPNVVGLTQTAATSAITGAGLVLGTITQQSSSTVAAGNVVSENPTAGTMVNTGASVNLVVSSGIVYDLSSGWSNSNNPNGPWSYNRGTTSLPLVPNWNANNSGWSASCNQPAWAPSNLGGNFLPPILQVNACVAITPSFLTFDPHNSNQPNVQVGDVIVHTVDGFNGNPGLGDANVLFTLPTTAPAGFYTISGSLWDAVLGPTSSSRPQDWSVTLNGVQIAVGHLSGAVSRSQAQSFSVPQNLKSGDKVKLQIAKAPASPFGFFVGMSLTITQGIMGSQLPIPNVVGLTQSAATSAITGAGLILGTVTLQSSTTVAAGNVISENPAAGTMVNVGSAVNLAVSSGAPQVAVPNVVGLTETAATSTITAAGLILGSVTQQSSNTVAAGNVISESPSAGSIVLAGSAVNLVISSGPPQVAVPNVVSLTQAAATSAITGAGLVLGTVTLQSSSTIVVGNVISENPTAGTMVTVGAIINLVISSGAPQVAVPNVIGLIQTAATNAITGAGLIVGTLTQQSSSTVAAGNVISENPTAGTLVNVGSTINLVVSSGPPQVGVPNVIGSTQASATSSITGAGLVVGTVAQQSSNTVAAGNVISENPIAGTVVNAGSAVSLVVSSGPATGPASITVVLSSYVIAPDDSITVTAVAFDSTGVPISPAPQFNISVTAVGPTSGNAPVISGNIITFPKLPKQLLNWNRTVDPNGIFTDTVPTDPNYGKQTGGVYNITASPLDVAISGSAQLLVLPSGTAPVTKQLYQYGAQLDEALNQILVGYGNQNDAGFSAGKAALQQVATNTNFSTDVLSINQALAPPDGTLVTTAQLTSAGLLPGANDAAWLMALQSVDATANTAIIAVNNVNPTTPTTAQLAALQSATANYQAALATLSSLQPSTYALTANNDFFNRVLNQDIPTLLDAVKNLASATSDSVPSQYVDAYFSLFRACVNLTEGARYNIVQLITSLVNDIVNLELASLINSNAPQPLVIDWVQAAGFVGLVSPNYPGTFVDAFSFDRDPSNNRVILVGAVNSGLLASILTFKPPKGLGDSINALFEMLKAARDFRNSSGIAAVVVPDIEIPGGGLLGDGSDQIVFTQGWPQVNQSNLPALGVVIVMNTKAGTVAATTIELVPD